MCLDESLQLADVHLVVAIQIGGVIEGVIYTSEAEEGSGPLPGAHVAAVPRGVLSPE